jgi:hypothetical protein
MILLSNGDSHTAGGEIDYEYQPTCYEKAWPQKLADKLGYESINLSKSGNSNQTIYRTTQDWIIRNVLIDKKYNPEDIYIMIMWSGFDRHEVYFPDVNYLDNVNPNSNPSIYCSKMVQEIIDFKKSIVSFHDNLNSDFRALSIVYSLSFWLDANNIKHNFINGLFHFPEIKYLNSFYINHALHNSFENLLLMYGEEKIKKHYAFSDWDKTFFNHMTEYSGLKTVNHSKYRHFGEDGHIYWAKKMYDFFFDNNKTLKKLL